MRARGQSLVELGLVAPVVILLAMAVWDGGSLLREQVVLEQAAREGARAAATAYGGASAIVVQDAVVASAGRDLAGVPSVIITNPDQQSVKVELRYTHGLVTPVLRQLWAGAVTLSASATFYVPRLTPVPATIVPSTPLPTATATPSATATPTPVVNVCARGFGIPPLGNNNGYYVTLQLTVPSVIAAGWTIPEPVGGQIELSIYAGNPFSGQSNPTPMNFTPAQSPIVTSSVNSNQSSAVAVTTAPQLEPAGTYSVFFFKGGTALSQPSDGAVGYQSGICS